MISVMSEEQITDDSETLFSFELLVEKIHLDQTKTSDQLAVALRLLDFPTLLIQQPEGRGGGNDRVFNRGKCCFFKMRLKALLSQLANTPLHAMVLDLQEETPRLVGTSLISLNRVLRRIRRDVSECGASAPSSHGERGLVGVCSLTGERLGSMSLSFKIQSLGRSLLHPATERREVKGEARGEDVQEEEEEGDDQDQSASARPEDAARSQTPERETPSEEDPTVFCPPLLFFQNSAEERSRTRTWTRSEPPHSVPEPGSQDFTSEDENKSQPTPVAPQSAKQDIKTPENKAASGVTPIILGEVIQELPLLNALLVELSQLSGARPQHPPSIHPNLAWIYRPTSAEPPAGTNSSLQKTEQGVGPSLKDSRSPRNCSTKSWSVREGQEGGRCSWTPRKRLVFGTTRTFDLRLKQAASSRGSRCECVELLREKTRASSAKEKKKTGRKIRRRSEVKQSSRLDENVETVIQNITEDPGPKEAITVRQEGPQEGPRTSERASPPLRDPELVHIPAAQSESDQSRSDRPSHDSSRSISSRSSSSGSAGEEDYADDFNSLEPSDPQSSPESSRAKTPKPDFGSEGVRRRAPLPVPVKATSPPRRALRGAHVIVQPRTLASALSLSSDADTSASVQTILSRRTARSSSSSGGQGSESRSSPAAPGPGLSESSSEQQEAEEVEEEDELGTLDFRKGCQHVSELVANKLPGYTI